MKRRVRIVVKPKAQSGLEVRMGDMNPGLYGTNGNRQFSLPTQIESSKFSQQPVEVNHTLSPVPRDKANIEAERDEVVMADMTGDGIPSTFKVGGDRHYAGGTPLNVPPNSFVFSDTNKMKIKDETILKMFGMSKKSGGVTPADIAKRYDINDYRKILADPDSDKLQRDTAEAMITNYNLKLAKLALAQESMKGFPQGIPVVAMPYIETSQTDPASFTQTQGEQEQPSADMGVAKYGGTPAQRKKAALKLLAEKGHLLQNAGTNIGDALSNTWNVIKGTSNPLKTLDMAWDFTKAVPERMIDQILEPYMDKPEVKAPPVKTLPGKKKAVAAPVLESDKPSVDTYFPDPSTLTSQEEADKWKSLWERTHPTYKKQLGGGLPEFEVRGENPYDIKVKSNTSAASTKDTTGKKKQSTGTAKETYGKFNPYASEKVREALYDPEMAYYEKDVAGKQHANPKGGYGDLSFSGFEKNNADILARFKEKFGHDYVKKTGKNPETAWYQKEYNKQLDEDAKAAGYNESERKEFINQLGFGTYKEGDPRGLDKQHGDWTNSRVRFKFKPKVAPAEEPGPVAKAEEPAGTLPPVKHLQAVPGQDPAAWWLQDIIKTAGAAGDFGRIKKYEPWQSTPGTYLPTPTFYDPTRELAANAEQANIQTQALGQFAGPQALSARSSAIQGQAAKNAADVMSRYNNLNVGVANDFETRNAGTLNEAARQKAGLDTQLFDKYTIANQQFDNSRNLARQNLRQSYIDAVTNRANTYNLNTVYPQYATDPMSGGMIHGHNFKDLQAYSGIPGITDQGDAVSSEFENLKKNYGEATALELMKLRRSGKA